MPWTRKRKRKLAEMKRAKDVRDGKIDPAEAAGGWALVCERSWTGTGAGAGSRAEQDVSKESKKKKRSRNNSGPKLIVRSLKFNNNEITTWNHFAEICSSELSDNRLEFLDFSFNKLTTIDEVVCNYPDLKVLYLHGNLLDDVRQVKKLKRLPNLMKLTLHGNPLEEKAKYRQTVINLLPNLKQLDFTPITSLDREKAQHALRRRRRKED